MSNLSWNQRWKNYTESDGPIWRLGSRMKYQVLKIFSVMYLLFKNFKFYVVNLSVEIRFLVEIKLHILHLRNKVFHPFDNFILYFLALVMVFVSIRIREKLFLPHSIVMIQALVFRGWLQWKHCYLISKANINYSRSLYACVVNKEDGVEKIIF